MAHLTAALAAPDISLPLLVVAAAQFALFAGADMTLLMHVWRAHNQHQHQQLHTQQTQRLGQVLLLLYVRFYLVLLLATAVSWALASQAQLLLLLAAYSFWVPQLLHNIHSTSKQPIQPSYILASSAARLLLPVYVFSCPDNILTLPTQPWLVRALLLWVGAQVALLLLQHYTHPHVLLPAALQPERYNYHRPELPWHYAAGDDLLRDVVEGCDVVTGEGVVECVICMGPASLMPLGGRVVTPCGHFYHKQCLLQWMEVPVGGVACPTCRWGPLPPL
ncbi:hypothetical protein COO60DRAFT_1282130 [Scenedesmus sp. NREL 46B-D3]|nr:hypothetical protein COO60DRAFT_1282130 [Scenedesmus sp. NREL 46B-D3]